MITDINFTENYILAAGVTVTIAGANLVYTDSILMRHPADSLFFGDTHVKFRLQYLNLPLIFKMRTSRIGRFKYYGALGLVPAFRIRARADAEANGIRIFDNHNIIKRKDQTGGVLRSVVFNLCFQAEGGIEFPFSGETALIAGIIYRHGLVNVLKDNNDDKIKLHNLGLRIGVIF